ncbi:MAG: diguanylate cyclase (GGDEF)-like protein [Parasphingorhabdus sp.]|jgi:diguanylate cyclase (GGDEF)-like protein
MIKFSLSQRFQFLLISLSLLAFLATMLIFGWNRYQSDLVELTQKLESQSNIMSLMLAEPMASNDINLVKSLTLSLITDRDFCFVQVTDADGNIVDLFGSLDNLETKSIRAATISFANESGHRVVGSLSLAITLNQLHKRHLADIQTQVAFFLTLVILLVAISHYAFRKTVSNPLYRLNRSIREYEEFGKHQSVERLHDDELGRVISAYNTMQNRQVEIQETLKAYQHELEELVDQRTRELTHEACHDSLTGLLNRREFKKQITNRFEQREKSRQSLLLCFIDLDHFKIVNDTHGHNVGDRLLSEFAEIMSELFLDQAIVGRLGGDEFGLLIHENSRQGALSLCDAFINRVSSHHFKHGDRIFHTSMSIGAVVLDNSVDSIDEALRNADECCYIAKERGRNRLHLYSKNDFYLSRRNQNLRWVSLINDALDYDQMEAWWQPICASQNLTEIEWVEILARYRDKNGVIHTAAKFLSPLEQFGVTTKLDLWILEATLKWISKLEITRPKAPLCSVNISGRSIGEPEFLDRCLQLVNQFPACKGKLCFEITETFAILNFEVARDFIRKLSEKGHKFALDDFGSGLSSFAYLRELEVNYLKIDGRFIRNIIDNEVDQKMVSSMAEIAHSLNLKTVAEYVESIEQAEKLQQIGIDYLQGNYLGIVKPLSEYIPSQIIQNSISA